MEQRVVYVLNQYTPSSIHGLWNTPDHSRVRWTTKCPPLVPGVHAAKWAGGWETPRLRKASADSPALLMLHIFSMPNTASRLRRETIRRHHPLLALPEAYRHLVDFKFIIGYPRDECRGRVDEVLCPGVEAEEMAIAKELRHKDLIRLEGLKHGENMDEGKTWEWIRHVGRDGGPEAQWVFKCDDDVSGSMTELMQTLPILQNLVPFLLTLNPSVPTYVSTVVALLTAARPELARRVFLPHAGVYVRYELGSSECPADPADAGQNPRQRRRDSGRDPIPPPRRRPYRPAPPLPPSSPAAPPPPHA